MIQKVILSTNDILYEILLWLISIPKTFIRVASSVRWAHNYIDRELIKEIDSQFDEYTPPIIFFLLLAVVPAVSSIPLLARLEEEGDFLMQTLLQLNLESKFLVASVFMAAWPLAASIVIQKLKHEPVSRSGLRNGFYTQAYLFGTVAPFVFLSIPGQSIIQNNDAPQWLKGLFLIPSVYTTWFLYQEYILVRDQLNRSALKSIGIVTLIFFSGFGLVLIAEIMVLIALGIIAFSSGFPYIK